MCERKVDPAEYGGCERAQELFRLPDCISEMYEKAYVAEVQHVILTTFGYDCSALDQESLDDILRDATEMECADDVPRGRSACRAFARFVREHGDPGMFGLSETILSEWFSG